jgi:hypothetical protein
MKSSKYFLTTLLCIFALSLLSGRPSLAQDVTVTAADPSSALQGTTSLDVTVSGNGFDSTAQVTFLVTGTTNPGGITVKKVSVRGSKKLVATIDIADSALVDKFDIEVVLSNGRKGKGTTLFTVQSKVAANDPCATPDLDFPAYIYWKQAALQTEIFVADSTGICARSIAIVGGPGGNTATFSFPLAGTESVGRVVYINDSPSCPQLWVTDFVVSGTVINIIKSGPVDDHCAYSYIDLSADGQSVYGTFMDPDDVTRLVRIRIEDGTSTVLAAVQWPSTIHNPSVNSDETRVFADLWNTATGDIKLVAFRLDGTNAHDVIAENPPDVREFFMPAADPMSDRVAYGQWLISEGLDCSQLKVWSSGTGASQDLGVGAYGRWPTWVNGAVVVEGQSPPKRRGVCSQTDNIVRFDPVSGEQSTLGSGFRPDGR